jgi:hypothetical protein
LNSRSVPILYFILSFCKLGTRRKTFVSIEKSETAKAEEDEVDRER